MGCGRDAPFHPLGPASREASRSPASCAPADGFDVLVCAGDVCEGEPERGVAALAVLARRAARSILVPGNHERYRRGPGRSAQRGGDARGVAGGGRRIGLRDAPRRRRRAQAIGDVAFIGATLWTDFSLAGLWRPGLDAGAATAAAIARVVDPAHGLAGISRRHPRRGRGASGIRTMPAPPIAATRAALRRALATVSRARPGRRHPSPAADADARALSRRARRALVGSGLLRLDDACRPARAAAAGRSGSSVIFTPATTPSRAARAASPTPSPPRTTRRASSSTSAAPKAAQPRRGETCQSRGFDGSRGSKRSPFSIRKRAERGARRGRGSGRRGAPRTIAGGSAGRRRRGARDAPPRPRSRPCGRR